MLRRSLPFFFVHRTLTGVTITDPNVVPSLDEFVQAHKLPSKPAAYWCTPAIAQTVHIKIYDPDTAPHVIVPESCLIPKKHQHDKTQEQQVDHHDNTTSDDNNQENVKLFSVKKSTDSPDAVPHHRDAGSNRQTHFHSFQAVFEAVAAASGYSSLQWFSTSQINSMGQQVRSLQNGVRHSSHRSFGKVAEQVFFNEDELVHIPQEMVEPLRKYNMLRQTDKTAPEISHFAPDKVGYDPTLADDARTSLAAQERTIQRSGKGKPLPNDLQAPLFKIREAMKYEGRKWLTTGGLVEGHLKPKPNEVPHEIIEKDGSLFVCWNADQLEFGHMSEDERRAFNRPMLATTEMEERAKKAGIFLDGNGRKIWQDDRIKALTLAHARTASTWTSATPLSRQYLSQWAVMGLGCEPAADAQPVNLTIRGGKHLALYNRASVVRSS